MARINRPRTAPSLSFKSACEHNPLRLPAFLEPELAAGHPWVYRNHVPTEFEAITGSWICAQAGQTKVWALWDNESQIALRVFSRKSLPGPEHIQERIKRSISLRLGVTATQTNAYRLINGEGDGLPGITVDAYGEFAVVATYSAAVEPLIPWLVDSLTLICAPRGIVRRRMSGQADNLAQIEVLRGEPPPPELVVTEGGVRYFADLALGHKTGLYLDQRDNRRTFSNFAKSGTVLNLFSYTGSFAIVAALAGASRLTNVDIAPQALARAKDNFRLNGVEPYPHEFIEADCYDYLKASVGLTDRFDAIVCDPPSLARNRSQLDHALKAYVRLNTLGLRLVRDGGFYAAASCTAQVSPEAFRKTLAEAARRAGCHAQIVHEAGHALDHPIVVGHPEGRYLKFVILRVLND